MKSLTSPKARRFRACFGWWLALSSRREPLGEGERKRTTGERFPGGSLVSSGCLRSQNHAWDLHGVGIFTAVLGGDLTTCRGPLTRTSGPFAMCFEFGRLQLPVREAMDFEPGNWNWDVGKLPTLGDLSFLSGEWKNTQNVAKFRPQACNRWRVYTTACKDHLCVCVA